jgi:flagellar basal-body rod protein FlgF
MNNERLKSFLAARDTMIRGLNGASTALDVASQAQDTIAQNLAHATVPGYRARGLAFETFDRTLSKSINAMPMGVQVSRGYSDFRPGAFQHTGRSLDLALDGDSFFVLQGPNGPLYTRDGVFQRATNGQLQSSSGLPVMGGGGTITLPPGTVNLVVGRDGAVHGDGGAPIGQIQLARFAQPDQLIPAGTTVFSAPEGVAAEEGKATVMQGYRELSNVQPATELVAMIRNSHYFDAAQRALRTIAESVQLNTRPQ